MDAAAARLQEVQQRLDAALSHGQDLEITVARTRRELQSVEAERNEVQRSLAATSTTLERTHYNHQRAVAALEGQLKGAQQQAQLSPRSLTPSAGDTSHYERELTMVRANAEQQERNAASATADAHSANRRVTDVQSVLANERTEAARRIADLEAAVKRAEAEVVACQGRQIELEELAEAVIVDCERIEQENDALRDRVKESERYLASVASSASVPNSPLGESASRIAMSASVAEAVKTATATMAEDLAKARRRQTEQRAALREALELASQLKIDINAAHATTRDTGGSLGNPQIARVVAAHLSAVDAWAVRYGKHLS
jgi:chromosome segregation ATPase